jgi:preprotein translocase subunit SecA
MSLRKKDENNIEALCITSIYGEDNIDVNTLVKNTYANMYLSKCEKVLSVFLYYSSDDKIKKIDFKIITSDDKESKSTEIMNMAEYLRFKRGLRLEGKKIGRNELCPCGSGKKYKKCCLLKEKM